MISTVRRQVRLWRRGQLTLPKEAREALHLEEPTMLTMVVIDDVILLTPKPLAGPLLTGRLSRDMLKHRVTLKDLLKDLKNQRKRYNREAYGA